MSSALGRLHRGGNQGNCQPAIGLKVNKQERETAMISRSALAGDNPKVHPVPASNTEKDSDDWVSGDEPMTGAQASYLKTKAEASKRIDALKARLAQKKSA
jgi:hypothetical protein